MNQTNPVSTARPVAYTKPLAYLDFQPVRSPLDHLINNVDVRQQTVNQRIISRTLDNQPVLKPPKNNNSDELLIKYLNKVLF